ncbi:unnamed protein product, partial [Meganyctiphanes norvegica]
VRLILNKVLPSAIVDQMRDSPGTAVHIYESQHENPDLIWTDDSRIKVSQTVTRWTNDLYNAQRDDPNSIWKFPEEVSLSGTSGEVVVGGVYLRLLQANPSWVLRKPKQFVCDLFDALLDILAKGGGTGDGETLELIVSTMVAVLSAQRPLLEYLSALGHIPRVTNYLSSKSLPVVRAATLATHQFTNNQMCGSVLESTDVIAGLVAAMKLRPDMVGVACESLHNLFSGSSSNALVDQGMKASLIPFLLGLLEAKLKVRNPASTKAQIVTCLKTMAASPLHSEQVAAILDKSSVWKEYKDQNHGLFLEDSPARREGIEGAPRGVAGYLTQGQRPMPATPPPAHINTNTQLELP